MPTKLKKAPTRTKRKSAKPLRTFQGRRIVQIKWQGRKVDAVEGLLAFRREIPRRIESEEAERGLLAAALDGPELDPLGIGILSTEPSVEIERAASAAPLMASDVLWVEPVMLDHGSMTPNDPLFSAQWGLTEIKAERAWDLLTGESSPVVLAVLDSGIPIQGKTLSHPDLNDETRFILGRDVVNHDAVPADDNGHGTHVIGIAAATTNNNQGVAGLWPGTVLVVKVFNAQNDGSSLTFKDGVLEAVRFAREQNARLVINYSGGGPNNNTKKVAVEYARDSGALLVAAAGNNHDGEIDYPAVYSTAYSHVVAVGAVDTKRNRAEFSSRGPELTVVSPGVDILSTLPNYFVTLNTQGKLTKYDRLDGTSMAAPLVSALAALIWSRWPTLSAEQVREKIIASADSIPGSAEDFGNGIINAERALS